MAFYEIGLDALVGSRLLFLNVSCEWLARPELLPFPSDQVVIELPDLPCENHGLESQLRHAKQQGYRLAANTGLVRTAPRAIASQIDIARVDVRTPRAFSDLDELRNGGRQLLASFVEDSKMLARAQAQQFDLYQGYFYAEPQAIAPNQPGVRQGNRAADLKLLLALYNADVELAEIEQFIVQDPHLVQILIRSVNSASQKRVNRISSVGQAISLLGLDKIRALVATQLLAGNETVKRGLVHHMLIRAAMARMLANGIRGMNPDAAFTVGLFSLIGKLEGVDLEQTLVEVGMDDEITRALLEYEGDLGKLLRVIESFEAASVERRSQQQVEKLNLSYLRASAWVEEIMAMTDQGH